MGALKRNYSDLFKEKDDSKNLYDKKLIEALRQRLNDMIMKDLKTQKKAALILEQWISEKSPTKTKR
jgi:hypothetical protein